MMKKLLFGLIFVLFLVSSAFGALETGGVAFYNFSSMLDELNSNDATNFGTTNSATFPTFNLSYTGAPNSSDFVSGSSQYIKTPQSVLTSMINADSFTVSGWFNPDVLTGSPYFYSGGGGGVNLGVGIGVGLDASSRARCFVGYSGSSPIATGTTVLSTGEWHHVACSYDGTDLKIYYNGTLEDTQAAPSPTWSSTDTSYIGRQGSTYYDGRADYMQFYNITLNDTAIKQLYNFGLNEPFYNFSITVTDEWDGTPINNVTANVTLSNGSSYIYTNTTGNKITTDISSTLTQLVNVTVSNPNYFTNSYSGFNVTSNLDATLKQTDIKFQVTEFITNNSLAANITINTTTLGNGTSFGLKAGSYNLTASRLGYYSVTQEITVSALENKTFNISGLYDNILNVTATQAYTGTTISGFNVSWTGVNISYTGSAIATTYYELPTLQGYEYNITVSNNTFITSSQSFTPATNLTSAAFELFKTNYIVLNFFDEETRNPILDVNYTLTTTNSEGEIGSTSTGSVTFANLTTDKFTVTYTAINYTSRDHIFYIPLSDSSVTNRSLYLLKDASATDFILTVQNKLGQPVEGLTASLLRQYVVDGQTVYEVVEMMSPSVALDGATRFSAVANFVKYLFRVQDANQNVLFQGAGTTSNDFETLYLIDSSIFIKVDTGTSPFDLSENVDGFQYSLTNSSNKFWYSYDDTQNIFSSYGLTVYYNGSNILNSVTSTSNSAILSVSYTPHNTTSYRAVAFGVDPATGTTIVIDTIQIDKINNTGALIFGALGWFILFLSLIVFTVGLATNIGIAILMDILAIIAFSGQFLGLVQISVATQMSLFVVGLIIVYLLRRSG